MRYAHARHTESPLVAVVDGRAVELAGKLGGIATLDELVAAGPDAWQEAEQAAQRGADSAPSLDEVELGPPLLRPPKIACIGLNFHDHIRETGLEVPERPLVFAKFASSIIGPGDAISWSPGLTDQVDWEVELAAVVGRRLRDVAPEEALDAVFGYTAANDVSARDVQFSDVQWVRGKSLDTFCPIGPVIVTADEFGDPQDKRLRTRVNGELMQDSTTAEMIFGVAELLSFLSASFTLEPGDLLLTGTPWGVGGFREPPVFLKPGDEVEVEVEGVGVLANRVVARQGSQDGAAAVPIDGV